MEFNNNFLRDLEGILDVIYYKLRQTIHYNVRSQDFKRLNENECVRSYEGTLVILDQETFFIKLAYHVLRYRNSFSYFKIYVEERKELSYTPTTIVNLYERDVSLYSGVVSGSFYNNPSKYYPFLEIKMINEKDMRKATEADILDLYLLNKDGKVIERIGVVERISFPLSDTYKLTKESKHLKWDSSTYLLEKAQKRINNNMIRITSVEYDSSNRILCIDWRYVGHLPDAFNDSLFNKRTYDELKQFYVSKYFTLKKHPSLSCKIIPFNPRKAS